MGDRRIFLKIFCASLFNNDLSNEPNFGRSIWLDSTFKTLLLYAFGRTVYEYTCLALKGGDDLESVVDEPVHGEAGGHHVPCSAYTQPNRVKGTVAGDGFFDHSIFCKI